MLQPSAHFRARRHAGSLKHWLPILKNHEIRNGLNTEPNRQTWVGFGVYLEDEGAPGHFVRQFFDLWRGHPAWAAPGCPEID